MSLCKVIHLINPAQKKTNPNPSTFIILQIFSLYAFFYKQTFPINIFVFSHGARRTQNKTYSYTIFIFSFEYLFLYSCARYQCAIWKKKITVKIKQKKRRKCTVKKNTFSQFNFSLNLNIYEDDDDDPPYGCKSTHTHTPYCRSRRYHRSQDVCVCVDLKNIDFTWLAYRRRARESKVSDLGLRLLSRCYTAARCAVLCITRRAIGGVKNT